MQAHHVRVRTLTLAAEEIRALPRQTFALGALAAVLGLLLPIASLGPSGPSGLRDVLLFLWLVGMLVVAIVVAARVASARRSRFVDSLYTTPLEQPAWLAAQALVGLFLAALVLLAQLPFVAVHLLHVGAPAGLGGLLLGALGMALFAVALGLFCGVIVGDSGAGAGAGLAGGVSFAAFLLLLLHAAAVTSPPSAIQPVLLRVAALSPLTLLVAGAGIDVFGARPEAAWRPLLGFAGLVAGLAAAAWLAYTRAQSPVGWEPGRGRALIVALVALAVAAPVATAETTYVETEDDDDFAFSGGEHTQVAFVARGAPITDAAFTLRSFFDLDGLELGEDHEYDVLVLLMTPSASVRDVAVRVEGSHALQVVQGGTLDDLDGRPDGQARPSTGFFADETPAAATPRPVHRVPVVLRPVEAQSLLGSPGLVHVNTTFTADGRPHASHARMTLDVEVPGAVAQLLLVGAPMPLAAAAALVSRKLRTR